jgi:hypothetical protein
VFYASVAMEATTLQSTARLVLVHTIAVIWFACQLIDEAGFAFGCAMRRPSQGKAAKASGQAPSPEQQAAIEGWEEAVAAGQWQEPEPVEPLCPGAWWDLIDPGSAAEADPEPPLRWAV